MAHPLGLTGISTRLSFRGQVQSREQGGNPKTIRLLLEGYGKKPGLGGRPLAPQYVISGLHVTSLSLILTHKME